MLKYFINQFNNKLYFWWPFCHLVTKFRDRFVIKLSTGLIYYTFCTFGGGSCNNNNDDHFGGGDHACGGGSNDDNGHGRGYGGGGAGDGRDGDSRFEIF